MKKLIVRFAGWLKQKLEYFLANENSKQFSKMLAEMETRRKSLIASSQANCSHIAGGNPLSDAEDVFKRTSIVWHQLNTRETIGICTNCQRRFFPSDPDYKEWRKKPSLNKMSSAGWTIDRGAESYLIRDIDPPPPVSMPAIRKMVSEDDPWLLNSDGTRDKFALAGFDTISREEAHQQSIEEGVTNE